MSKYSFLARCLVLSAALTSLLFGQDSAARAATGKALDHVIGTLTAVDKTAQTVTVQEDKTNTPHVIQLAATKTLLKVEPSAKDLKSAVRITANDLEVGDRVDVRGTKLDDTSTTLNARSVILMSARDLEATHQQQAAAWSKATSGRVTAVDPASGKINADIRAAGATQNVSVQTAAKTEFTRYAPDSGKPAPSQISEIQVGDQLKVIGDRNDDGSVITAQRVYSGAFRTISMTVSSLGADGKSILGKELSSKKEIMVSVSADASIHKLPPMMAAYLARRLNPNAAATAGAPNPAGAAPPAGSPAASPAGPPPGAMAGGLPSGAPRAGSGFAGAGQTGGAPGSGPGRGGDISQMIQRTPTIALTDLKPGDALVISGVATGGDNSHLVANTIIAGVEPILQSAPDQRGGGRSVGGDWGLGEMSVPQ